MLNQYVIDFKEDMATANGRNPDPADFIAEMKLRGKVSDLEEVVKGIRAEYQETINNLVKQLQAISDQELTDDEIALLNTYRTCKKANGDAYQARINALEKHIEDSAKDYQAKPNKAIEVLNAQ